MKNVLLCCLLAVILGCGQPSSPESPASSAAPERSAAYLSEALYLLAGKYSINIDTLMRLLNDYSSYTGREDIANDVKLVSMARAEGELLKDEIDQVLDIEEALRLLSQKYNVSQSVLASLIIDYKLLSGRCPAEARSP